MIIDTELVIKDEYFDIDFIIGNEYFDIDFEIGTKIGTGGYPYYEGSYVVTPRVTEQLLPTKDTVLEDDVTIFQIPYSSVSNPAGGNTVTIGLE